MDYSIVVIGGSAGSLGPLQRIMGDLPGELPAAVFVTTHVPSDAVSAMPHILSRAGQMFATHAIDRAPIAPGRIIIAPPNYHLFLENGVMRVLEGPRENGQRPSIDVLFRSAAVAYGNMACGVLLSGTLDDGVSGLKAIQKAGGETLVQDPADALFPDMPRNALIAHAADRSLPAAELADAVCESVEKALCEGPIATNGEIAPDEREIGEPSCYTCPTCGGVLWEAQDGNTVRFRCHTGHAFNVNAMLSEQKSELEDSLWTAIRVIVERKKLIERLARRSRDRGDLLTSERFLRQMEELAGNETAIRASLNQVVSQHPPTAS